MIAEKSRERASTLANARSTDLFFRLSISSGLAPCDGRSVSPGIILHAISNVIASSSDFALISCSLSMVLSLLGFSMLVGTSIVSPGEGSFNRIRRAA